MAAAANDRSPTGGCRTIEHEPPPGFPVRLGGQRLARVAGRPPLKLHVACAGGAGMELGEDDEERVADHVAVSE